MGFLSNAEQERQLAAAEFQSTFVQAVVDCGDAAADAIAAPGEEEVDVRVCEEGILARCETLAL